MTLEKDIKELRNKFDELVIERDKYGDIAETYTNGYKWGHCNGQIELLSWILGIENGCCQSENAKAGEQE